MRLLKRKETITFQVEFSDFELEQLRYALSEVMVAYPNPLELDVKEVRSKLLKELYEISKY
jgi:hypothetical protein